MHEPSDGIAEELERQLQLALAAAAIAARRAIATRQHQVEQAQRQSAQHAHALKTQIDAERQLAAAHLQPVFNPRWWDTATPRDGAEMWQQADSWRDPGRDLSAPTIFDHAAGRIGQEVRDRTGLDPTQLLTLAAVEELEREHQATLAERDPVGRAADAAAAERDLPTPRGFDDPQRREQLRTRLEAAGVPERAIEARTLADLGQAERPPRRRAPLWRPQRSRGGPPALARHASSHGDGERQDLPFANGASQRVWLSAAVGVAC